MPNHIKYFEWVILGSIALGIIQTGLPFYLFAPGPAPSEPPFLVVNLILPPLLVLLVLLTSRKRSNIAKWILVLITAFIIVINIALISSFFEMGFAGILLLTQSLLQCVGIYFLFTEESRNWFKEIKRN
jgi:O-antigen/teichoic acid export membrane protein